MATVFKEQEASRTYSYDAGKVTATRVFKVWDDAGFKVLDEPADVIATWNTSVGGETMPQVGSTFPGSATVFARSFSISREQGTDVWVVTWTYQNISISPTDKQPQEPGYVQWNLDIGAGFVDAFFENPSYPTNGDTSATESSNQITTGTQRDIMGEPISVMRYTSTITITEVFESAGGLPAAYATARAARGKRNSDAWQGIEVGKAVYKGVQAQRIGVNLWQLVHNIEEASDFHLIQYPERDTSGRIPTEQISGRQRAKRVYWRQPFPQKTSFAAISTQW